MATITPRKRKDGSYAYTAQIRINVDGERYTEAQTFDQRAVAEEWAKEREKALKAGAARRGVSLSSLVDWYVENFETIGNWGRTKSADLRKLKGYPIGEKDVFALTTGDLVKHVQWRRETGAGPATAGNDLVWIGVVLRAAKSVRGMRLNPDITKEAREACRKLRIVAKSRRRDRLPTYDELERLDDFFARRDPRSETPMRYIMWFAIYSARRQEEITRLMPEDNDPERKMGIVRDLKHPDGTKGNDRRFRYTDEAWEIMQRFGPFHYNPKTIGSRFRRACQILGIEGLKFHDLRHEATTRLFERGLTIPEVASYTLHDSWQVLKRYTHLGAPRKVFDAPFLEGICETRTQRS